MCQCFGKLGGGGGCAAKTRVVLYSKYMVEHKKKKGNGRYVCMLNEACDRSVAERKARGGAWQVRARALAEAVVTVDAQVVTAAPRPAPTSSPKTIKKNLPQANETSNLCVTTS